MSETNSFFTDPVERAAHCEHKDAIISPILRSIHIRSPDRFKAVLMPCLHGPEIQIFKGKGVPGSNLIPIERNTRLLSGLQAKGLDVSYIGKDAYEAVDHIEANHTSGLDAIYLDFLGNVGFSHRDLLEKVFKFRMVRPGGKLILTFGKNRCAPDVCEINRMLLKKQTAEEDRFVSTKIDVLAAIEITGHRQPIFIKNYPYKSKFRRDHVLNYVTTEIQF